MWNNLKDKSIIFPSSSTIILLMDIDADEHSPFRYTIMPVIKVLEICDKPYCHWTHWMRIPPIVNDYIDEDKLDELAKEKYPEDNEFYFERSKYIDGWVDKNEGKRKAFKAGYHKAKEE